MKENVFAIGDLIRTDDEFDGWVAERLTGLGANVKVYHTQFV